jgi:hypothetical protein
MFTRKNTRNVFEKKVSKNFRRKNSRETILEKFSRKILKKFTRKNSILWVNIRPHRGPRVKLKDRGLGLKSNKNKYTHVGLNILGLNMRPKYRAFQYGGFFDSYTCYTHNITCQIPPWPYI